MSNMRIKYKRLSAENVKLKAALGMTVDAMLLKCEKSRELEAENAALRDKIEQAERAMRPFWK